jgi:superkiller protein 3
LRDLARQADVARLTPALVEGLATLLRDHDEEVTLLRRAQRHNPGDFWLNYRLASALYSKGAWQESVGYYRAALALRPQTVAVYIDLGNALDEVKDLDGAVQAYQRAIQIEPRFDMAYYNLGKALHGGKDLDGAERAYQQAIRLAPANVWAHNNLGLVLSDRKDHERFRRGREGHAPGH